MNLKICSMSMGYLATKKDQVPVIVGGYLTNYRNLLLG